MFRINLSLFAQIMDLINLKIYFRLVHEYRGDKHRKGISTLTHFVAMLYMRMANAVSLLDISKRMHRHMGNLKHWFLASEYSI